MTTIAKEKSQWYAGLWEFWDLLVDMLDFSHFAEPRFLLFAMSNFLLYTWYDVPYVYLTDYALEMGFSESESSMLISIVGIVNMFGEVRKFFTCLHYIIIFIYVFFFCRFYLVGLVIVNG